MFDNVERDEFLKEYQISLDDFRSAMIPWDDLLAIKQDFISNEKKYQKAIDKCDSVLSKCSQIHSKNPRIKNPEHLVEKIIRKNPEFMSKKRGGGSITIDNYENKIRDLVGFRIVLLYKDDWPIVHDYIISHFKFAEKPFAYVVKGDDENRYKEKNVRVKHRKDYRSVHYVVKCSGCYVELQVRTLAEEVWGEIDHNLRYPLNRKNEKLTRYMALMSDLTGCVDRMAAFVCDYLKDFERKGIPLTTNEVYNKILSKLDEIDGNEDIKKEIADIIVSAEEYQRLKETKDLIASILE